MQAKAARIRAMPPGALATRRVDGLATIRSPSRAGPSGYSSQAQPGGVRHTSLRAMQVLPQALPLRHMRQHELAGDASGVGSDAGGVGFSTRMWVSVVVLRPSTVDDDSPRSTAGGGGLRGGSGTRSTTGSGGVVAPVLAEPQPSNPVTTIAVRTRMDRRRDPGSVGGAGSIHCMAMRSRCIAALSLAARAGVNTGRMRRCA